MTINIADFLNRGYTFEQAITNAICLAKGTDNVTIDIPKGDYDVYDKDLFEDYIYITNNDHSLKRILFYFKEQNGLKIVGNGSNLMFHGRILPFVFLNCKNVELSGFTIDYDRTFYTQGEVLFCDDSRLRVRIDKEEYPYTVKNGVVEFSSNYYASTYLHGFTEYNPVTKKQANASRDNFFRGENITAKEIDDGIIEFYARFNYIHKAGNFVVIKQDWRLVPGLSISGCDGFLVEDVTFYHSGSMAMIAQTTRNITLRLYNVMLPPDTKRIVSATADATHFVHCTGRVVLDSCYLANQLDDATNIHSAYALVDNVYGDSIDIEIMHFQQNGVNFHKVGDKINFLSPRDLQIVGSALISRVFAINQTQIKLMLSDIKGKIEKDLVVENVTANPEVLITDCTVKDNRGRAFLLSTNKRIVVENNTISAPSCGIRIAGGIDKWYEAGATDSIIIKNNRFLMCNYVWMGDAVIDIYSIKPGVSRLDPDRASLEVGKFEKRNDNADFFHKRIEILDNVFETYDYRIVKAADIETIVFKGNKIIKTNEMPPFKVQKAIIDNIHTGNIELGNNDYGEYDGKILSREVEK